MCMCVCVRLQEEEEEVDRRGRVRGKNPSEASSEGDDCRERINSPPTGVLSADRLLPTL